MWIITDSMGIVQDKASHAVNLSRGYLLAGVPVGDDAALAAAGFKKHEITDKSVSVKVLDYYDGQRFTPNVKNRARLELDGIKHEMIEISLHKNMAKELGFKDKESEFEAALAALNTRKVAVEAIIAK